MDLNELARECHAIALSKGWYDTERTVPELLMLCVSELAEALESYRRNEPRKAIWTNAQGRLEGFPAELADAIIRILDMCGFYGIDIQTAFDTKMAYNRTRSFRHGNKRA